MNIEELREFVKTSPEKIPSDFIIGDNAWKFAVRSVLRGKNLLLLGDSGCGKTRLAREMHKLLGREFFYINMGGAQDARSTLIGNTHYDATKGTYVSPSYFVEAIQKPNAIILLDEFSRANNDAHNILMTVLDYDQRYLRMDEKPDSPTIHVAEGVTFIMTANVGSEYTATRTLDRAILDRSVILLIPNLTAKDEQDLLTNLFPEINPYWIRQLAVIAGQTRDMVKAENDSIDTIISTRNTIEICSLMMDGFTFSDAADAYIYPLYSDFGGGKSPRTTMQQMIQRVLKKDEPIFKSEVVVSETPEVVPEVADNTAERPFRLI